MAPIKLGLRADIKDLTDELAAFRPDAGPGRAAGLREGLQLRSRAGPGGRQGQDLRQGRRHRDRLQPRAGHPAGPSLGLKSHKVFDRLVYSKLRAVLGGRATHAISGGAPLGERLGHFYRGIGFTVLEGYGLTESCAATAFNPWDRTKIGTVGQPLPGSAVRIADDGEVLLHGEHLFTGYWNNQAATTEALSDGWFHTGDLGTLDEDGYLPSPAARRRSSSPPAARTSPPR